LRRSFVEIAAVALSALGLAVVAGERDEEFAQALLKRGYYDLLELQYRDWLSAPNLSQEERARKKIGLARLYAARAHDETSPSRRSKFWKKAVETLDELIAEQVSEVLSVQVRLEKAKLILSEARIAATTGSPNTARRAYREAIAELEKVQKEAIQLLDQASPDDIDTRNALLPIAIESENRLAWARYELASLLPADDDERRELLNKSLNAFKGLATGYPNSQLAADAVLGEGMCLRALGYYEDAIKRLKALISKTPPLEIVRKALYNIALCQFELGNYIDAVTSLNQALKWTRKGTKDELYYACLLLKARAIYARAARSSTAEQTRLIESVGEIISELEAAGGPWRDEARELKFSNLGSKEGYQKVTLATQQMRDGNYAQALISLREAAGREDVRSNPELLRRINFKMGVCLYNLKAYEEAGELFAKLFEEETDKEQAQRAGYYAVVSFGMKYDQTKDEVDRQVYMRTLRQLLERFPDHPKASELHFLLAEMYEADGDYEQAAAEYEQVGRVFEQYPYARVRAALCYERMLRRKWAEGGSDEQLTEKTVKSLQSAIAEAKRSELTDDSGERKLAPLLTLRLVRLYLDEHVGKFEDAARLLRRFAVEFPEEKALQGRASLLLLVVMRKSGDIEGAAELADELLGKTEMSREEIDALMDLVSAIAMEAKDKTGDEKERLCRVAINLCERLSGRKELSKDDYIRLVLRLAELYPLVGEWRKGAEAYETLKKKYPGARDVEIGLAISYEGAEDYAKALEVWRRIAAREEPGSTLWWEAKYHIVEMHLKLGHYKDVIRIVNLLRTLRPSMGGEALSEKFRKLENDARDALAR